MALTVLGLGPGAPELLTLEARQVLSEAQEVWLRTARHPMVGSLPAHLTVRNFDSLYEEAPTFEAVYDAIVEQVWDLARRPEGVLYAVPGHPLVAEATVLKLLGRCRSEGTPARVVAGLSFIEPVLHALEIDPFTLPDGGQASAGDRGRAAPSGFPGLPAPAGGLQLVDALRPCVDPARQALIAQLYSQDVAAALKVELLEYYPPEHPARLIVAAGTPDQRVLDLKVYELDRAQPIDHLTCLFLPPLALVDNVATFNGLAAIIARLRAPGGCPWDREQTHASLKPYLLEEAYEALEALEDADPEALRGELGDLLLNIMLHCQLAAEVGEFQARDVVRGIAEKLIRRHPHVFGEVEAESAQQVVRNWEALKEKERSEGASMLSGLSRSLPALAYTRSLQERLAPLGLPRMTNTGRPDAGGLDELGRAIFELAYDAAERRLDPEEALRHANRAFTARVERAEQLAREEGSSLQRLPQERREALWTQAEPQG